MLEPFKTHITCFLFSEVVHFSFLRIPTRGALRPLNVFPSLWLVSHGSKSGSVFPEPGRGEKQGESPSHPRGPAGPGQAALSGAGPWGRKGAGPAYLFLDRLVALLQPAPPPSHVLPVGDRHSWQPRSTSDPASVSPQMGPRGLRLQTASPPSHTATPPRLSSRVHRRAGLLFSTGTLAQHPNPGRIRVPTPESRMTGSPFRHLARMTSPLFTDL